MDLSLNASQKFIAQLNVNILVIFNVECNKPISEASIKRAVARGLDSLSYQPYLRLVLDTKEERFLPSDSLIPCQFHYLTEDETPYSVARDMGVKGLNKQNIEEVDCFSLIFLASHVVCDGRSMMTIGNSVLKGMYCYLEQKNESPSSSFELVDWNSQTNTPNQDDGNPSEKRDETLNTFSQRPPAHVFRNDSDLVGHILEHDDVDYYHIIQSLDPELSASLIKTAKQHQASVWSTVQTAVSFAECQMSCQPDRESQAPPFQISPYCTVDLRSKLHPPLPFDYVATPTVVLPLEGVQVDTNTLFWETARTFQNQLKHELESLSTSPRIVRCSTVANNLGDFERLGYSCSHGPFEITDITLLTQDRNTPWSDRTEVVLLSLLGSLKLITRYSKSHFLPKTIQQFHTLTVSNLRLAVDHDDFCFGFEYHTDGQ